MSLTKERLRFSTFDDLCLLREVLALNPFEDSSRWKDVLTAIVKGTSKKFSLRAVKEHLQYILMLWAKEDRSNIRKSGTEEEYDEKEVLLQQVTDLSREFRGKTKPINVTPNKAKIIGSDIRNIAVIEEGQASASTDTILEYGDTSEIPSEFDLQKSGIGRNRRIKKTALKSAGLQFLHEKQVNDIKLKEKQIEMENRRIACEEKKIKLQERQLILEESKFELDKNEREARLQMELEERRHRLKNETHLQDIVNLLLHKMN
ncbi:hypothetical protein FQR65_LT20359 [Abscondita terminalis]|nr:hypothetical protein FQR65_LT20359 [Abscondita terminalis]